MPPFPEQMQQAMFGKNWIGNRANVISVSLVAESFSLILCYLMSCNEQPSQATANPVGGKAFSSTKGG